MLDAIGKHPHESHGPPRTVSASSMLSRSTGQLGEYAREDLPPLHRGVSWLLEDSSATGNPHGDAIRRPRSSLSLHSLRLIRDEGGALNVPHSRSTGHPGDASEPLHSASAHSLLLDSPRDADSKDGQPSQPVSSGDVAILPHTSPDRPPRNPRKSHSSAPLNSDVAFPDSLVRNLLEDPAAPPSALSLRASSNKHAHAGSIVVGLGMRSGGTLDAALHTHDKRLSLTNPGKHSNTTTASSAAQDSHVAEPGPPLRAPGSIGGEYDAAPDGDGITPMSPGTHEGVPMLSSIRLSHKKHSSSRLPVVVTAPGVGTPGGRSGSGEPLPHPLSAATTMSSFGSPQAHAGPLNTPSLAHRILTQPRAKPLPNASGRISAAIVSPADHKSPPAAGFKP